MPTHDHNLLLYFSLKFCTCKISGFIIWYCWMIPFWILTHRRRVVTRTLIGGVYSYIHVLVDEFLFKSNLNCWFWKEICRAKHEYMNINAPINVLVTFIRRTANLVQFKICTAAWKLCIKPVLKSCKKQNWKVPRACKIYVVRQLIEKSVYSKCYFLLHNKYY